MILVDTSVWIEFLRVGNTQLQELLNDCEVATHTFVIGELHVGNISRRKYFLSLLEELPKITEASHEEVINFINQQYQSGMGPS